MSEIISTLFGRPKNDTADSPEDTAAPTAAQTDSTPSDVAGTDETVDTEAIETESTEDVAEAGTTPDAKDADESTEPEATEETDESTEPEADEADEPTADEDLAPEAAAEDSDEEADDDEESAQDDEPVAVEAEDAAAVVVPVVEPAAEPAAEPARAAAGTRGNVTVDHGVVAKVVTIVAGKIDGVHSLATDGISVEVDGDVATIKISLVIEFGHAIKALAEQVRIDVIEAVEQFLGFDVAAVDVHVSDIHLPATA